MNSRGHGTLLQRLQLDKKSGLNYEYMGYAEYEFGATAKARAALAELFVDGELEGFECTAKSITGEETYVCGFCKNGLVVQSKNYLTNFSNKGGFITPDTVGWMSVEAPLLLLRDQSFIPQADLFLKPFVDGIKEERLADAGALE